MEIEAKFSIPDEQTFQRLLEMTSLVGLRLGAASVADLQDKYLDTAGWAIRAQGYACRLRRTGDRYLATLKGLGGASGAIHRRLEYEVELAAPAPPQEWPPSSARGLALRLCGGEPLRTLFEIEQTRHSRPLWDHGRIVAELNLDRVSMCQGGLLQRPATYLELEVELLSDSSELDLEKLVAVLQEVWGLTPQSFSKYERALALIDVGMASEDQGAPEVSPDRVRSAWPEAELAPPGASRDESSFTAFTSEPGEMAPPAGGGQSQAEQPSSGEVRLEPSGAPPLPPEPVNLLQAPGIEPEDAMSEAGRKTFRYHYRRMLYNEPGTREGEDIEALHDMRVATRRMRAAFRVFGPYFEPKAVAPHLKGLKRTGRALGAVRDLDVFRVKIQRHLDTLPESQHRSLDDLLAVLEDQREAARTRMVSYLDSGKYHRFVERFGEFVETEGLGGLVVAPDGDEPRPYRVRHVAPMAVYERLAAVRAYDEWVSIPDPPLARLHALRISCKRLRYALEFFCEVLGPDTKQVIGEIVAVQDHLGELQDAVVASGILREFLIWGTWGHDAGDRPRREPEVPLVAPGVAVYLAAKQSELRHLVDTFPGAWQRLRGAGFGRMVAEAVMVL